MLVNQEDQRQHMKELEMSQDPFIIVKNYRQKKIAVCEDILTPRIFLRELDGNTLVNRSPWHGKGKKVYLFEDKQNFNFMGEDYATQMMRTVPTPNHEQLVDYSQYDFTS